MSRKGRIRRIVHSLLDNTNQVDPPVNVEKIADYLGASIRYESLNEISGILFREDGQMIVGVNKYDGTNKYQARQRFTIAHELGHLMLHEHKNLYIDKMFPVRLRDQTSSEAISSDEIDANAFAAELLMPKVLLEKEPELGKQAIDYEDERVIEDLAKKYNVSQQAMTFRLINLGFIHS